MRNRTVFAGVGLLVACAGITDAVPTESWLTADVTGSLQDEYHGGAEFRMEEQGTHYQFHLVSRDGTSLLGRGDIALATTVTALPEPGVYSVGPPVEDAVLPSDVFVAAYFVTSALTDGATTEHLSFAARSGQVRITRSSPEGIEGSFAFTAGFYCRSVAGPEPAEEGPCQPTLMEESAPTINVTGTFFALPNTSSPSFLIGRH